ncbi:MAG: hypothetical protein ACE5D1_02600 [Fidelibacterota bacterium]
MSNSVYFAIYFALGMVLMGLFLRFKHRKDFRKNRRDDSLPED